MAKRRLEFSDALPEAPAEQGYTYRPSNPAYYCTNLNLKDKFAAMGFATAAVADGFFWQCPREAMEFAVDDGTHFLVSRRLECLPWRSGVAPACVPIGPIYAGTFLVDEATVNATYLQSAGCRAAVRGNYLWCQLTGAAKADIVTIMRNLPVPSGISADNLPSTPAASEWLPPLPQLVHFDHDVAYGPTYFMDHDLRGLLSKLTKQQVIILTGNRFGIWWQPREGTTVGQISNALDAQMPATRDHFPAGSIVPTSRVYSSPIDDARPWRHNDLRSFGCYTLVVDRRIYWCSSSWSWQAPKTIARMCGCSATRSAESPPFGLLPPDRRPPLLFRIGGIYCASAARDANLQQRDIYNALQRAECYTASVTDGDKVHFFWQASRHQPYPRELQWLRAISTLTTYRRPSEISTAWIQPNGEPDETTD